MSPLRQVDNLLARTRNPRQGRSKRLSAQVKRAYCQATTHTTCKREKTTDADGSFKAVYTHKRHEDRPSLKSWARYQAEQGCTLCQRWLHGKHSGIPSVRVAA